MNEVRRMFTGKPDAAKSATVQNYNFSFGFSFHALCRKITGNNKYIIREKTISKNERVNRQPTNKYPPKMHCFHCNNT